MKSILIVDDDSINCLLAKHALAQDYHAIAVKSGKDALAFLEKTIPDLILMDIEMPEMDGKEDSGVKASFDIQALGNN